MLGTMSIIVSLDMFCPNVVSMVALSKILKIVDTASVSFMLSLCLFAIVCALCWVLIERSKIKNPSCSVCWKRGNVSRTLRIHTLSHPVDLWPLCESWLEETFLTNRVFALSYTWTNNLQIVMFHAWENKASWYKEIFFPSIKSLINVQHFWTTSDSMV